MMVYLIDSLKYKDILLVGPVGLDLLLLEDEWAITNSGTVVDFAEWLVDNKGFERSRTESYSFSRD